MYKIFIDTTDRHDKSVELFSDNKKLGFRSGEIDVVSSIAEVLKEVGLKVSEIDKFDCNPGPGSFTGIKVGVTIVNVLNFFVKKKGLAELTKPQYGREPNIQR